jgi:hypothetical protein
MSFYIGASVLSAVLWTVLTTEEKPPKDMKAFRKQQEIAWALVQPCGKFHRHSRYAPDHAPTGLGTGL